MLQNNHPEGGNDRFQVINFHLFVAGAIPRVAGRKERRQDCRNNPDFCMDLQRRSQTQVTIYFFAQEAVLHSDSDAKANQGSSRQKQQRRRTGIQGPSKDVTAAMAD